MSDLRIRSMMVGDMVLVEGRAYIAKGIGFKRI